jgi:tetratricopeptide (TPR) repeat protein
MNAENFHEYIKNPSMLYQVNYQELKSLVLQYPYAPNLRTLLVLKNLLDNHKDYNHNLTLASVYSIDRKKLREQIKFHDRQRGVQENYALGEDSLELMDLATIEDVVLPEPAAAEEHLAQEQVPPEESLSTIESLGTDDFQEEPALEEEEDLDFLENLACTVEPSEDGRQIPADGLPDEVEDSENRKDEVEEPEAAEPPPLLENLPEAGELGPEDEAIETATPLWDCMADVAAIVTIVEDMAEVAGETAADNAELGFQTPAPIQKKSIPLEITNEEDALQPVPKSSFNSWLQQFQPPEVHLLSVHIPEKPGEEQEEIEEDPMPPAKDEARKVAARSIAENFGVASETLAALLEAQGLYDKAIAMYERLCLQYPEKNSFFAAKIEELKNK